MEKVENATHTTEYNHAELTVIFSSWKPVEKTNKHVCPSGELVDDKVTTSLTDRKFYHNDFTH
jgi:hypothetical protein